jgi:hypothetical protein
MAVRYFQLTVGGVVMPKKEVVMRKIWKLVFLAALCLAGFAVSGVAPVAAEGDQQQGEQPRELPPSPLEAFAARSTATVVWRR